MTHPNRSKASESYPSFVILLPALNRLWKHAGPASEAIFSSVENARRVIANFGSGKTLVGAKVMRIAGSGSGLGLPPEPDATWHDGWWLVGI